jgi:hypothetical protein
MNVLLCDLKSHTTHHASKVSHHPSFSKIIRNSENCFATSFDNHDLRFFIRPNCTHLSVISWVKTPHWSLILSHERGHKLAPLCTSCTCVRSLRTDLVSHNALLSCALPKWPWALQQLQQQRPDPLSYGFARQLKGSGSSGGLSWCSPLKRH